MTILPDSSSKLVCVALNDVRHREIWSDKFQQSPYKALPTEPVLYFKPRNTWNKDNSLIPMDTPNAPLVVGASLALLVGKRCQRVSREDALQYISGISVVHDISSPEESYYRPDILGKGIDKSAAMNGNWQPVSLLDSPTKAVVSTKINGKWRGDISTDQFEMSIPELIERISRIMTLEPGDIIAPCFHGERIPVRAGDKIESSINGHHHLTSRLGESHA
ncbi:putative Fumarylacetoacetate (FAA) hydrolase [Vibrio nigripulchritudo SFn27]|uniref:Putative Fumarylacetoacetate (FAA) hydrolase n=1 Tax=Vibrio nigripulchritudo TaxID=28173 RepID=U4KEX2_9VIBR|nr:fumarylacetoacetate hydrolase family protein [Vibrio nigripulchritudo]CCN81021.1 putative Fumarylacetoacetate (FAA) hydrolase [Vibrio nigripulchritudo BLFn1]CCN90846.1 putative Fumarylacetoacetate (FAA) hydrolase [Vibrio nigripulchritudo SFn27]CCN96258.1 putative Fumarylacetoacetate (FAA) hydrolase [Vibrio nigripulchritudo ENn2]CCO42171.1 putative Fumarylacetoacetate (FAA) hydrolase [Vibrio nigripulchritudo SFn135]CCO55313.1 putative Fumarylacetoacetate (FAA) hydrolase [Vibrio nigripulchrit